MDFGFVWGFVLASFGDTTFHALQEDTHANIPPRGFVFGLPASFSKECARFCKIPPKMINFIQILVARILTVAHLLVCAVMRLALETGNNWAF